MKMGSKTSLLLQEEEIFQISTETGFTPYQISRLYSRFISLDKNETGQISSNDLMRIPELAINPIGHRIVEAFFTHNGKDVDTINFRQFVRTLAIFRPPGKNEEEQVTNSKDAKLKFAFSIYDIENSGTISTDDLLHILKMMIGSNMTEEELKAIAERTLTETDKQENGSISYEDFEKTLSLINADQIMNVKFLD